MLVACGEVGGHLESFVLGEPMVQHALGVLLEVAAGVREVHCRYGITWARRAEDQRAGAWVRRVRMSSNGARERELSIVLAPGLGHPRRALRARYQLAIACLHPRDTASGARLGRVLQELADTA